jgi:hypothetical protein
MGNLVGNIKNRRVAQLEQACERYATMVYEVLRRELAFGFKSITYGYQGSETDRYAGTFTATFVPCHQTHKYRHGHRATHITFRVFAGEAEDNWCLSHGMVTDIESGAEMTIRFSDDGRRIAINIPDWDEIRYSSHADHGQEAVTTLNKEPWGTLMDFVII